VAMAGPDADCAILVVAAASTGRRILRVSPGTRRPAEQARQRPAAWQAGPGGASHGTGRATLAITVSGDPSSPPDGPDTGQTEPYAACQKILRPGGVLAVLVGHPE